jgi:RNA recognition motif-containing protein
MNHYSIENKTLKVSIARVASLDIRNCKLYITNIPLTFMESDVITVFERVSK